MFCLLMVTNCIHSIRVLNIIVELPTICIFPKQQYVLLLCWIILYSVIGESHLTLSRAFWSFVVTKAWAARRFVLTLNTLYCRWFNYVLPIVSYRLIFHYSGRWDIFRIKILLFTVNIVYCIENNLPNTRTYYII